jgi:hypothetical protein
MRRLNIPLLNENDLHKDNDELVPTPNYLFWARFNGVGSLIFIYITYSGEFLCM